MISLTLEKNKKYAILSSDTMFEDIREFFSIKNEAAVFTRKYNKFIASRLYCITPTGRVDVGLVPEILKYIRQKQYVGEINISPELVNEIKPGTQWNITNPELYRLSLELRDYQTKAVLNCIKYGRGTIVLATAGGKTLIIASLLSTLYKLYPSIKTLIIVPDRGLVSQTYLDFQSYFVPFSYSKWTGNDEYNSNTSVNIANIGIIMSKNTDLNKIKNTDILIIDEVHSAKKTNELTNIIKKIKTPFKFGFTGTLPESKLDQWNILGKIGPVIFEKDSYELRQEKYISDVLIQIIKIHYKSSIDYNSGDSSVSAKYRQEIEWLGQNTFRNQVITKLSLGVPNNILILVDRIEHGETITSELKKINTNKQIFFIQGSVEVEEREHIKNILEHNDNVIIVAISKIFSTGVNIKNLHYIIFAGGGKAKIRIIQSIGRGLRLNENKEKLVIIDIADQTRYGIPHLEKRLKLYETQTIKTTTKEITEK